MGAGVAAAVVVAGVAVLGVGLGEPGAGAQRSPAPPPALATAAPAAGWQLPLAGPPVVTRPFVAPAGPYAAGHRGVDLAAPVGASVLAAAAGRVTYAGLLAGRGVVVVTHGELRTTYEPVVASVQVGDQVGAGAVLGRLAPGHQPCPLARSPSGGCLHWGLRRGETYLDPMGLLRRAPSRLLPVQSHAVTSHAATSRWRSAPLGEGARSSLLAGEGEHGRPVAAEPLPIDP